MKESRNPFRMQSAESIESDADFLRLFGHGVLDLLPKDVMWTQPLFIRSAPGGGKTSLLKLFTPNVLINLVSVRTGEGHKEILARLQDLGAVADLNILVLGVMVTCKRTFPSLADLGLQPLREKQLFMALLDARIMLGAMKAALTANLLRFPEDLERLQVDPKALGDLQIPGLPLPCSGAQVKQWAEQLERSLCDMVDSVMSPDGQGPAGHASLISLRIFDHDAIVIDGRPLERRWLVMLDDVEKLSAHQRAELFNTVVEKRSRSTVWLAERFEALTAQELLSNGALNGRDYGQVINLEKAWQEKRRFEPAVTIIADRRARMAAEVASNLSLSSFVSTLEGSIDTPEWQQQAAQALEVVSGRMKAFSASNPQYAEWVKAKAEIDGSPREKLIALRALEILIERHRRKKQRSFDFVLPREEVEDKNDSDVRAAAELFLSKEFGFPYYFGLPRLACLGSFNVEQFLRLAGDLFEEVLAAAVLRREPRLGAARQQKILDGAYDARVKDLPRRAQNGRDVLRFLESVGLFCKYETHRPNAPYAPGVTGIAMTMLERDRLLDKERLAKDPASAKFAAMLATALAYNLLHAELDYSVKGNRFMVLYLNRLLCPKYDLPLQFGGFREKPVREFISWLDRGYRPPNAEPLFQ